MSKDYIYESMQQKLGKIDLYLKEGEYSPLGDGIPCWTWRLSNELGTLALVGKEQDVGEATIIVYILPDKPEVLTEYAGFVMIFIDIIVPEWKNKTPSFFDWFINCLESQEDSSIVINTKLVELRLYEELNAIALFVTPIY